MSPKLQSESHMQKIAKVSGFSATFPIQAFFTAQINPLFCSRNVAKGRYIGFLCSSFSFEDTLYGHYVLLTICTSKSRLRTHFNFSRSRFFRPLKVSTMIKYKTYSIKQRSLYSSNTINLQS